MPSDKDVPTLKEGDVVKVMLGVHIDGYASVHAETLVVGADASKPVEGVKADALKAAWEASQVAVSRRAWASVYRVSSTFGLILFHVFVTTRVDAIDQTHLEELFHHRHRPDHLQGPRLYPRRGYALVHP